MVSICYFIVVDNDKLICYEKDSVILLPHIKIDKKFAKEQEAKDYISQTTKFTIGRSNFALIYHDRKNETFIYSCIIDANQKINKEIIKANFVSPKCILFGTLFNQKWDSGSKSALSVLEHSNKYKEAISFLKSSDLLHYYSKLTGDFIKKHFVELNNVWQSEKPDIFIESMHDMIGIEEFSFDASLDKGSGSTGIVAEKEVLKSFDNYSKNFQTLSYHVDNSKENYVKNFKAVFDKHIKKINTYLINLRTANKENKNILFGFWVKDETQLGTSYFQKGNGFLPFFAFQFKEFWDFFFFEKSLDFIIFSQEVNNSNVSFLITREDYDELSLKNKIFKIDDVDLLFMNDPIVMGQNIFISLEDFKKK